MILTAHQPAYLPWLGYFHKIACSDLYVYLDNVQFEKNSFTNRNKIKTNNGGLLLTVPVLQKGHLNSYVKEIKIDPVTKWSRKHFEAIKQNYSKAPFYGQYIDDIAAFYQREWEYLSDLCIEMLHWFLKQLEINTKVVKLSDLPVQGSKQELIINLCHHFGAEHFIFGALGRDYADAELFKKQQISIHFQDYKHPEYPQLNGPFLPYMSVVDLLMNCGPQSKDLIFNNNLRSYI